MTLDRYRTKHNVVNYEYKKRYENITNSGNLQYLKISEENHYTSCGYDMIDKYNQRDNYDGHLYPIDRVAGYEILELEKALKNARYWNEWRDNIKNQTQNPAEIYIDELFNNWQD